MSADGNPGGRRRRRALDAEERALWQHVTRSIRPMHSDEPTLVPELPPDPEPAAKPGKPAPAPAAVKPAAPPGPPPLAPLEPKLRRRLSRGSEVDARLDLHGLTQAVAHRRLHTFLLGAQGAGHVLVLVITGKGAASDQGFALSGEGGRGVLRRLVPQWLAAPEMRTLVVGFETAARGHGGEGALYVRVRRTREPRR
jgi:DNA-nicking Smr family endonuclease